MKKSTLTLLLFILGISSSFSVGAQEAKTVFVNIPDSLCPLLSSVNRADCIDFIESKMKAQVTNRFGGKSEMTELSPDYVSLQMSDASNWQMKLLPLNDTTKWFAPFLQFALRHVTVISGSIPRTGKSFPPPTFCRRFLR